MSRRALLIYIGLLLLVLILGIAIGSVSIHISEVFDFFKMWVAKGEILRENDQILYHIRLPRVASSALVGILLSLSGLILQGLLQNPLAESSTLGITGGAALGAAVAIVLKPQFSFTFIGSTAVLAIAGSFVSVMLVLGLVNRLDARISTQTLLVVGIIFSMFTGSLLTMLLVFFEEDIKQIVFWTMGSLGNSNAYSVGLLLITACLGAGVTTHFKRELNILSLGEERAENLGVSVRQVRLLLLILASVMTGVAVSIAGGVAFVGLIVPHFSRKLFGANYDVLIPSVIFNGAIFLIIADLVARTAFRPLELPIGALTSLVGSLLLISVLIRERVNMC